ncbi:MAG: NADH-quinone oxidoreductase subunit NuoK [bacterium]
MLQVLLYVGGVVVLLLFAIMLTSRVGNPGEVLPIHPALGAVAAAAGRAVGVRCSSRLAGRGRDGGRPAHHGDHRRGLAGEFLLPFEVASVLLLAAAVEQIVIALATDAMRVVPRGARRDPVGGFRARSDRHHRVPGGVRLDARVRGLYCVISRRNAVALLMGVELISNAAALNFVAFSHFGAGRAAGHVGAIFVIVLAAAEAAVALAIVLALFKLTSSVRADKARQLRG